MERSVRRAEKLVHATNSALAQMKLSMMFDDMRGERGFRRRDGGTKEENGEEEQDLRQCEEEFRSEAKGMLTKMERMLAPRDVARRNAKAVERIKEINRKMGVLREERGGVGEQGREKVLSLLVEGRVSPEKCSGRGSVGAGAKGAGPSRKEKERLVPGESPLKRKEELRSNILETREIVDRGFQTARHLTQKVENMRRNERNVERKEKEPRTEAVEREVKSRSSGDGKIEMIESVKETRDEREEREDGEERGVRGNRVGMGVGVVEVKRSEGDEGGRRLRLRVQQLPSVEIRGGLQVQSVHRLEIGGEGARGGRRSNTGVHFLCHEELEKGRLEKVLDGVRRENVCWGGGGGEGRGRYVECSGCGKVTRVEERWVDPRGVEEVLRKCNFNVFDPRIDEFVERWRAVNGKKREEEKKKGEEEEEKKRIDEGGIEMVGRGVPVEYLSNRVASMYREEAERLEGNHLRLDNLLRKVLRRMDESKEVLEGCNLFKKERAKCGGGSSGSTGVMVKATGSCVRSLRKKERLEKKDVKNRSKSRTEKPPAVKEGMMRLSPSGREGGGKAWREEKERKEEMPPWRCSSEGWSSGQGGGGWSGKGDIEEASGVGEGDEVWGGEEKQGVSSGEKSDSLRMSEAREEEKTGMYNNSNNGSCSSEGRVDEEVVGGDSGTSSWTRESEKLMMWKAKEVEREGGVACLGSERKDPSEVLTERSEKDYESDFESTTNEAEGEGECNEREEEVFRIGNKLSTILEVESELERKLSDEQKTQRDSFGSEALLERAKLSGESGMLKEQQSGEDVKEKETKKPADSSPTTAEASLESTPTELVSSLKDILSALKDQFARTETLAEKLTENVKREKSEREGMLSPLTPVRGKLMERVESARKGATTGPNGGDGLSGGSLSEEGGSSLGEMVMGGERRGGLGKREGSSGSESGFVKFVGSGKSSRVSSGERGWKRKCRLGLKVESEEISYSEGELEGNMSMESDWCSSRSMGEIRDKEF